VAASPEKILPQNLAKTLSATYLNSKKKGNHQSDNGPLFLA
jgi:hypothetical protein